MSVAWQYLRREQEASTDDGDLFGRWWEGIDISLERSQVRSVTAATAATIIMRYEWMASMPAVVLHCFGIYFDGVLGGAVVYSPEYAENLGVWDKYGYTGQIILLARGASAHWTPKNTASKLIQASLKMLPPRYEVVTATVDSEAGEVGTIYQACGWDYVGVMRSDNPLSATSTPQRTVGLVNGARVASRSLRRMDGWTRIPAMSKGRYFTFRGRNRKQHRQAIAALIRQYPKRQKEERAETQ